MDNKTKSQGIRLTDETKQQFADLAKKYGYTQEECMKTLIHNLELQDIKMMLGDRKKEIETFESYMNGLFQLYKSSLEINKHTEDKIKEELHKKLEDKDYEIAILKSTVKETDTVAKKYAGDIKDLNNKIKELQNQIANANDLNSKNTIIITKLEQEKNTLVSQLNEYKSFKDINIKLVNDTKLLNDELTMLRNDLNEANLKEKLLNQQIYNLQSTIEQHKLDLSNLKEEYKLEKKEIKEDYQQRYAHDINNIHNVYNDKIQGLENDFDNRLQFEKDKIILELNKSHFEEVNKLNNIINELKIKE